MQIPDTQNGTDPLGPYAYLRAEASQPQTAAS